MSRQIRSQGFEAAVLAAAVLALMLGVRASSARAEVIDGVVASVDGEPITSHDVKIYTASNSASGSGVPMDQDAALKSIIQDRMLKSEARNYADKVTDDEIDRYIANLEQTNHMTDDQLRQQLKSENVSYDEFRERMREQVEAMTMIDREVRQKIVVPDSEIDAYYQSHLSDFTNNSEKFQLAQILVAVPKNATPQQIAELHAKAAAIRKQAAKSDADFSALALQYSDDDSKNKGGELGEFSPSDLNDAVAAGIKNLKEGQVSDVIRTKYGFHIIKVEEHQMPGLEPINQVRSQIRDQIQSQQSRGNFEKWVDTDLAKQHYVETLQ